MRGWYGRIQARAELLEIGPAFEEYAFGEKAPAARVLWQNAEMPLTADLHRRLQAKYWLLLMQDPERSEEMAASWPAEETPALVAYAVPNGKTLYAQTDGELKRVRLCLLQWTMCFWNRRTGWLTVPIFCMSGQGTPMWRMPPYSRHLPKAITDRLPWRLVWL